MSEFKKSHLNRRSILKSSLAMLAGSALTRRVDAQEPAIKKVNQASSPSTLKITGFFGGNPGQLCALEMP